MLNQSTILFNKSTECSLNLQNGKLTSSSAFPATSPGFTILGEICAYVTVCFFFNPTIEVVTFHFRGWCMLDVFLLPAFTRLGHECHNLLSPECMECMCAQTRPWFMLSSERVFGDWSQNPCELQAKNPLYQKKISSEEYQTHNTASSRTASPTHYQ